MAQERRIDPLPDGRYWVELQDPLREQFNSWRMGFKDQVRIEETESDETASPPWSFFIFTVKGMTPVPGGTGSIFIPVVWPSAFGFPTIAPPSVKSRKDAITLIDLPPSGLDQLGDALGGGGLMGGLGTGLKIAGYGFGAWVLLKLIGSFGGSKS